MKKLCILICAILCTGTSVLANDEISVYVDSEKLQFEVQPQIINDYTMVPMRTIFERLGYNVQWFQDTRTISAVNYTDNKAIILMVDVPKIVLYNSYDAENVTDMNEFILNHTYDLDIAPIIVDDNTLVPLRAISEASGADVIWDGENRDVYITLPEIDQTELSETPIIEPTEAPIEEAIKDKYYSDSSLLNYKYFSSSSLLKTKYGYNYYFDQNEFDNYIDSIENDGWTVEKPYERYNDLRLTKGEETARIVWDNKYIVVIVDNKYMNSNMFAILNDSAEKMQYNEQIDNNNDEDEKNNNEYGTDSETADTNSYKFVNNAMESVMEITTNKNAFGGDGVVMSSIRTGVYNARNDLESILILDKDFEKYLNSLPDNIFQLIYESAEDAAYHAFLSYTNNNNYNSSAVLSEAINRAYIAYLNKFYEKYNG